MNREIKFRAWDGEYMVYEEVAFPFLIFTGNTALRLNPHNENDLYEIQDKEYEFMQFTGLKDKNGVEVYEGDIISELGAFVLWDTDLACWCFNFKTVDTPNVPLFYRDTISKMEVLGNIYQKKQ